MASIEIVSEGIDRFGIEWDADRQVLTISKRMHDAIVELGLSFDLDIDALITWILDHTDDIAHKLGLHSLSFRDHIREIFIE